MFLRLLRLPLATNISRRCFHSMSDQSPCPLCASDDVTFFHTNKRRDREWLSCKTCELVFVPPKYFLSADEESKRYAEHNNNPDDERYCTFLRRLIDPVCERLQPHARGLDFGSGPTAVLAMLMRTAGFQTECYDPFFAPDKTPLEEKYDFITCCEVAEHFQQPAKEFPLLDSLMSEGGMLGIMTGFLDADVNFTNWYYQRDPTHVVFYRPSTFRWLAKKFNWLVEFPARNVVVFRKQGVNSAIKPLLVSEADTVGPAPAPAPKPELPYAR
eukprot:TRINITY_DN1174_c0_g1_i2.p1 TRINITY_DN1174_c0_g1~~TRINITY_DN1174_c0_g1_i2.p1  ORF type:complete len:271 (+),score=40.48 TRINITY_DN1174_c0_g1_i2:970-1782(+)